jgi:hypothetical protein
VKVYLATSGEYSDYCVRKVFLREEDADAYPLADCTEEFELHEGPVDVRSWITLTWRPERADATERQLAAADQNPAVTGEPRDFDGNERNCSHSWGTAWHSASRTRVPILDVQGWDLDRVRKVYSEQRAQFIANRDMGVTP